MATVTGFTADRMQTIEDSTVVDGNVVGDDLILTTRDGTDINAGSVRGPQGIQGPTGEVTTAQLNAALAAEHVGTGQLVDGAVTSAKILNSAVTTSKIADLSVTGSKIPTNTINNGHLAANSVDSGQLVDGSVDEAHLANNSVTSAAIAASAVGTSELASSSVTTAKLSDGAVTNAKLGTDAVNGSKIANNSINSEHYVDGSIDNAHYANGSITASKFSLFSTKQSLPGNTDVTGNPTVVLTSGNFSCPANSLLMIDATMDFQVVTRDPGILVACIMEILVDGVPLEDQGVFVGTENGARATINKTVIYQTGNLGTATVQVRIHKNHFLGTFRANPDHSLLRVVNIPG